MTKNLTSSQAEQRHIAGIIAVLWTAKRQTEALFHDNVESIVKAAQKKDYILMANDDQDLLDAFTDKVWDLLHGMYEANESTMNGAITFSEDRIECARNALEKIKKDNEPHIMGLFTLVEKEVEETV
jgi:hypothetical protein